MEPETLLPDLPAAQVQTQQVVVFEPERIREQPTEPDPLAERWHKRIEAARKHWKRFYERCEHNRRVVENICWDAEADEVDFNPRRANLIMAAIGSIMPNLYAKNPEISVVPVRDRDADSGRLDKFTSTLEQVLNRYFEMSKLKQRAKAAVRSALTCSYGIVKVVYSKDMDRDPLIRSRLQDAQDNLNRIDGLLSRLQDDDGRAELEAQKAELEETIKGLQSESEPLVLEGLVIDRVLTDQLIIDPTVVDFDDYVQADWMCQMVPMRRETAEELYKVKLPSARCYEGDLNKAYQRAGEKSSAVSGRENHDADDMLMIYEVWDRISQRVYTLCDGCNYFLREPYSPEKVGGRWYPFFLLPYNQVDGKFVAQSLVDSMEKLQDEHNDTRDAFAKHRSFCKPGYITGAEVDEKSITKFAVADLGEITVLNNAEGQDLRSIIQPKTYPPIDQALYDTSLIRQDIEQVTGLQDAMRQSVVKPKTATEAQIMQQGLSSRVSAFRDSVEDWLTEIASDTAQILLRQLTEEDVRIVCGDPVQVVDPVTGVVTENKPYEWPSLSMEQVAKLVKVKIVAGSTGAPNRLEDQENWGKLLPTLMQLVQMLYQLKSSGADCTPIETLLAETVRRYDDRFDPDLLIPNIQSAMQMRQQAAGAIPAQGQNANPQLQQVVQQVLSNAQQQ